MGDMKVKFNLLQHKKKYSVIFFHLTFCCPTPKTDSAYENRKQKAAGSSRSRSRPTTRCPRPRCAS